MCDLKGDIETVGLLLDSTVHVSLTGHVLDENDLSYAEDFFAVKGVYSCIGCSVEDILPLVGYRRSSISSYLMAENYQLLPVSERTIKEFNEKLLLSTPRGPEVCLVQEGNSLFGVLIDHHNKSHVLGTVTRVLPPKEETKEGDKKKMRKNVLVVGADGAEQLTDSKTVNLDGCIKNGATVGIVSLDGFLLFQTTSAADAERSENCSLPQLTLILSPGYLVLLKGLQVVWTRRQQQHQQPLSTTADTETLLLTEVDGGRLLCKHSQVGEKQIFVATAGLLMPCKSCDEQEKERDYLKEQQQQQSKMVTMNLLGTHNAILNYEAFRLCIATYDQHNRLLSTKAAQGQEDVVGGGDGTMAVSAEQQPT